MAIGGMGFELDIPMIPGSSLLTTTSQYMVCAMVPATSTSTHRKVQASFVADLSAQSVSAHYAIGINQSAMLSATSEVCTVRLFGISKAVCAVSITAGSFVIPYRGISTTSRIGTIDTIVNGSCTIATTSITSQLVVLGRALESGATGTVISVFVNPQLYDTNLTK